jgi:hypothetical protein
MTRISVYFSSVKCSTVVTKVVELCLAASDGRTRRVLYGTFLCVSEIKRQTFRESKYTEIVFTDLLLWNPYRNR